MNIRINVTNRTLPREKEHKYLYILCTFHCKYLRQACTLTQCVPELSWWRAPGRALVPRAHAPARVGSALILAKNGRNDTLSGPSLPFAQRQLGLSPHLLAECGSPRRQGATRSQEPKDRFSCQRHSHREQAPEGGVFVRAASGTLWADPSDTHCAGGRGMNLRLPVIKNSWGGSTAALSPGEGPWPWQGRSHRERGRGH